MTHSEKAGRRHAGLQARNVVVAGLALVLTLATPLSALAEETGGEEAGASVNVTTNTETRSTDGHGNGVQSQSTEDGGVDWQGFITTDDGNGTISGTWQDSNQDAEGAGDWYEDGKVHLFYNTLAGSWWDPGRNPEEPGDDGNGNPDKPGDDTDQRHDNGTFIVTIPTKIAYDGMNVGKVSTSDDYTVNVRGVIQENQVVTLTAQTGNFLVNGSKTNEITETTTQGKTTWTSAETFNKLNPDNSVQGTDTTDNISLSGLVTTAGIYEGSVAYEATLSTVTSPGTGVDGNA